MQSPCGREASQVCLQGCCPASFLGLVESANPRSSATSIAASASTTARASRANFVTTTAAILFPNTYFTNHESLPSLQDAYSSFVAAYPQFHQTGKADRIREQGYQHLSDHVCLDYTGFGLFSRPQLTSEASSSESPQLPARAHSFPRLNTPYFNISYRSASLKSLVQQGSEECAKETAIRRRIMRFINILEDDYAMICTANKTSAFKLLAESYPFQTSRRLLTAYDCESEAVNVMADSSQKRGAKVMSANFSWPSLRINSAKMNEMIIGKRKKRKRGLFVFPLQSSVSGARYSYLWMRLAQENGWHVLLDACALGSKDLDTLGLSLIQPDFLICSFFKVFGEDPSGFACLFVRRSSSSILESTPTSSSVGIVHILPDRTTPSLERDSSGIDSDVQVTRDESEGNGINMIGLSCQSPLAERGNGSLAENGQDNGYSNLSQRKVEDVEHGESSEIREVNTNKECVSKKSSDVLKSTKDETIKAVTREIASMDVEFRGLNDADSLGLLLINCRLRYLTNWLVIAFTKLQHPHPEHGHPLVRIYGPRVKFDRGPSLAFNVFDWKGEKIEPVLVQKLADRNNISLNCGFLQNIWFSHKYEEEKDAVLEKKKTEVTVSGKKKERIDLGFSVVNASLGFLSNFEDAYKLWVFVAKFLDADFVEKERWRYIALNQKMIEV